MAEKTYDVTELFGSDVFNEAVMKARLPKAIFKELMKVMHGNAELTLPVAEVVASTMKDWAVEKGATHYTHWFQPMTGITAEKHDSFISPVGDGTVIMEFSGKELIKGEPDASSFPSGGLRATFEARGYTAWDPTSYAFIKDNTLYIPTAFFSYSGEALDKKTPLLKSMDAVSKQALRILKLFGNTTAKSVVATVGAEQEYFLVDKKTYDKRKDLIFTGRTLFGAAPVKGQELEDHYFGVIKQRVSDYMKDLDKHLWALGVSSKTKHNEVAPAQHECAPIFESANLAADHNQLMMEMMKKVALEHDMVCLLHEKPFAGVNGSGKHDNWALSTDDGQNLLNPGDSPMENAQFLTFLVAIIKAVDEYADLLRLSVATAGNDHRLGANEAPPAIISIFLGEELNDVINALVAGTNVEAKHAQFDIGVTSLPKFPKDTTDRNRTSPFAFTGNKFEFRMVGSTQSIAFPMMVLNTIVADQIKKMTDELEGADDFETACKALIRRELTAHQRIIFNGNGYSDEWVEEAAKRGLPNIKCMVDAVPYLAADKSVKIFENLGVMDKAELEARADVMLENYAKKINIEALTMIEMSNEEIIPAVMEYQAELAKGAAEIKALGIDPTVQVSLLNTISEKLTELKSATVALEELVAKASDYEGDTEAWAKYFHNTVFAAFDTVRKPADELEKELPKTAWPFPTYEQLLFEQ